MRPAALSLGVLTATLLASAAPGATVTGAVKGPDGTPFRGAFVQAQDGATNMQTSVLTGRDGRYRIPNLASGTYQISVRAVGYRTDPRGGVLLAADQNAASDFALKPDKVHWNDLSQYQGSVLFPAAQGS